MDAEQTCSLIRVLGMIQIDRNLPAKMVGLGIKSCREKRPGEYRTPGYRRNLGHAMHRSVRYFVSWVQQTGSWNVYNVPIDVLRRFFSPLLSKWKKGAAFMTLRDHGCTCSELNSAFPCINSNNAKEVESWVLESLCMYVNVHTHASETVAPKGPHQTYLVW